MKPTEDVVDVDSDSDAESQGGGNQGKTSIPIHTVRLSMKLGSASIFRRTVNPVALGLAVTPPVDAEEIKDLSLRAAIRHAIHAMSEAFILASSGSRHLEEGHDDAWDLLADLKKKMADLEQRLEVAVKEAGTLQKSLDNLEVAHRIMEGKLRRKAEEAGPASVQAFRGSEGFQAEVDQIILGRMPQIAQD
ncbi:unnamed protein product [Cuscuta epithymum]|uniref:Uncharacterized protein n=1 Tax=Cuscuta epithymum TaxID=186058 RepID=A0AAV0CWX4_9ASTE|nr:unnamed protein product [Cuscuta epithymum]